MKKEKRLVWIGSLAVLLASLSPCPSMAGTIKKINLQIEGEIKTGDPIDGERFEVSSKNDSYTVEYWEFVNGNIAWDRRDTPKLAVYLKAGEDSSFSSTAAENLKVSGMDAALDSREWIKSLDEESLLCLYLNLPPLSRPGESALNRKKEIEGGYANLSTKKQKEKLAQAIFDGWYEDANGWWYYTPEGSYPVSQWKMLNGSWYYFDGNGYMAKGWLNDREIWYYLQENGELLTNAVTPDGYQVNENGEWIR